ncbi:MAG TPA: protease modulator HflC [Chiayiivirga sp.]|jgi:membrane protease subunit HflC|uniref:Protein HflC n=1 Tax=Denitratimonas tolerans TaxID=1338420 RepID=A0AAW9R3T6_9GAMM|nr:protease modulator HflC [Xanthomonadaceae bacterium]MDX9764219.1 protease modulator HflC [Chiayiivirga sp.]HMN35486.1 protease modulator HflC [Chiayiivirga sp.]HRN60100.1 protease modulator HflC [Chiayiivirga sp.]HRO88251.1 protease modulator HflC [Chiayiivirga sp.]
MKNAAVILVLFAVLLLTSTIFVVREDQVGVLFQLGRIVKTDIEPGVHFKLPLVQDARTFDRRIMTLDSQPERYLTSEKKDVNVDFFAKWRIVEVGRYYTTTSGDELQAMQRLNPIIKEALRNQINQRTLQETVSDARSSMTEALVRTANEGTRSLGIEVVDVRIKRIDLPEEVSESVYNRMRAERSRVANELRSQGVEASETIRANADRERQVILANAERDAQRIRGEGDAQAADIYARAYGQDAEFYAFHRSLESYRTAFEGGDSVLVLDPDSEFFRYFGNAGRGE